MSEESIGDILNSSEAPEPVVETPTEEVQAAPETSDRLRDEHGRFARKDEETGVEQQEAPVAEQVPPTEQSNQLPPAEYAALKDERRRRQEAEARATQLEAQYLAAQRTQPQQPPVDFWEDPNAFLTQLRTDMRQEILGALRQEQQAERLNSSEATARSKYPDYQEAFGAFEQAVQLNPRLAQELARSDNPGEFAYSKGKSALALEQYGSIDALLAAEKAKWESEVMARVAPQRLPQTTAADGSVGDRSGPGWAGATPLSDILKQ